MFSHHFISQGRNSVDHARHYLSGLTGTQRRKNIETIENDVKGSNYQGMEQFISSSPWCHRSLLDDIAKQADQLLGDDKETCLAIDETSFLKKGKASVGVKRQWSGRAGKVDNCQVGVFAGLAKGERYALIDFQLYLPEEWAEDEVRCEKAKIPEEHRVYKSKWQQALELVQQARKNNVRFGWVGVDALYGSNLEFLRQLEDMGEKFMADTRKNTKVWIEKPNIIPPCKTSKRGRKPTKYQVAPETDPSHCIRVDELTQEHFEKEQQTCNYRSGTKGKLTAKFWVKKVWLWEEGSSEEPREYRLIVRQDSAKEFKYSLTNRDCEGLQKDAYVQNQRYWIEHSFHEAKSQTGMAQYQVRVWRGWHHHMALICLATLIMDEVKQEAKEEHPLLSCRDITELLAFYLPRRGLEEKEVHEQILNRHQARQQDIDRRRTHIVGLKEESNLTK